MVLNAANEAAVMECLEGRLPCNDIPKVVEEALNATPHQSSPDLDTIIEYDKKVKASITHVYS